MDPATHLYVAIVDNSYLWGWGGLQQGYITEIPLIL